MGIREYNETEVGFSVETADDVSEILDRLHTEVEDNLGGDDKQEAILRVLSNAIDALRKL